VACCPTSLGVLVRDGYAGYARLPAIHAWCVAHLLRDLRSISDADPRRSPVGHRHHLAEGQPRPATAAREHSADRLDEQTLRQIRNHYHGALARADVDNADQRTSGGCCAPCTDAPTSPSSSPI
jgi:transposase